MASIRTGIQLQDNFSGIMNNIINITNRAVSSMQNIQRTMGDDINTSGITEATSAVQDMDGAINNIDVPNVNIPVTPIVTEQPQIDVPDGLSVQVDVSTTGVETSDQRIDDLNNRLNEVIQMQDAINTVGSNLYIIPDDANSNIRGVNREITQMQQALEYLEENPFELDSSIAELQIESMSASLDGVIERQQQINDMLGGIPSQVQGTEAVATPTATPIQWQSDNTDVFTGSGMERYQQEIQSINTMLEQLSSTQEVISNQAASTNILPSTAQQDIQSLISRIDSVRNRIQEIEDNPLNMGTDETNQELEQLRSQLSQAISQQGELNQAVQSMDVSSANSAYMRLSQTISGTERYIRDNNTAQTQLNSSISQGTSKAQSFVNAIMGLSVVQSVIGVVKGQIDSAITRMDTMTNYNRTMTAITGSSDAASASLEKLKQVTTGTAYGLDTAASGVQNFVTRGLSLGTAVDQVSDWADAVAFYGDGTNETLSTVTDALGKMLSKGTVEMEQLNRLTDAGINAVGIYAQATGQATATVQDNLSAGKISSQEFITTVTSAFENGTNGVLNISGAAKEAGGTWATSISNAKAAVTRGVIDMVDGINDGLANAGFGSLLNGVTEFGVQAENVLSKLGTTTGQVITAISPVINTVIGIFSYISDNANITLSSVLNGVVGFVNATVSVLQPILSMVGTISSFIVDNWGSIIPIIAGIVTVMLTYNGALATYNAIMAISETITAAKAFASQVHAAALAMESGATFLATAGQLGFNAALLACPVTWIVIGIVAIVAAVVALANHIAKSGGVATTTFGVICGAVATAGAFIWNIVLGLVNSVITIGVNLWNLIQNFVAAFSIVFNNPIAAIETAFLSMFNFIVGIVSSAASIIDTVFGSNLADTVEGFQDKIQAQINATVENSQGYTPNTLNASDYTLERKNYSDTYASGAKWGDNVSNKIKNALSSKLTTTDTKSSKYGGTDLSDYSSALGSINNNTAKTADSASKAAKSLDVTSEDLKYLRDIAERDVINRYTTASITVNQTNHNTVNNDMDLDGVTEHLRSTLEEQMNMAAEGVY